MGIKNRHTPFPERACSSPGPWSSSETTLPREPSSSASRSLLLSLVCREEKNLQLLSATSPAAGTESGRDA